jgi:Fe-S oxidoreductase
VTGAQDCPPVLLPQEWLLRVLPETRPVTDAGYRLLAHCTEKTNVPASVGQWQQVFARAGLRLDAQASGCCGMSGTYGHESRNLETSKVIFEQSWGPILDRGVDRGAGAAQGELPATGYSCRSQAARFRERRLRHPVEVLLETVKQQRS